MPAQQEGLSTKKLLMAEDSSPALLIALERDRMRRYTEEEVAVIVSSSVLVTWGFCKDLFREVPSPP